MKKKKAIAALDAAIEQAESLAKVFCPTGEGGGRDPSCGKDGGQGGGEGESDSYSVSTESIQAATRRLDYTSWEGEESNFADVMGPQLAEVSSKLAEENGIDIDSEAGEHLEMRVYEFAKIQGKNEVTTRGREWKEESSDEDDEYDVDQFGSFGVDDFRSLEWDEMSDADHAAALEALQGMVQDLKDEQDDSPDEINNKREIRTLTRIGNQQASARTRKTGKKKDR